MTGRRPVAHLCADEGRPVIRLNGETTVVKLEAAWPHALANLTDEPVTSLTLLSPGDQSGWVDDEEQPLAKAGGDPTAVDEAVLHAVHERYGLEILGPPPDWDGS